MRGTCCRRRPPRRQAGVLEDAGANLLGGRRGGRQAAPVLRDIEIGLIERQRLDQRRVVGKDRVDLARDGAIDVEARRHEHQLRALAHRRGRRHGRAHAEGAGLIARRGHHASLSAVADRDRPPAKGRVVALLDRRIEGVHVDVDDLAHLHAVTISGQEQKENSGVSGWQAAGPYFYMGLRPADDPGSIGEDQTCLRRSLICSTVQVLQAWRRPRRSSRRARNGR